MNEFYYARNSEKLGPFSLEELRSENITPQTLVWFEGLPSWQYAEDLEEIQSIFQPVVTVEHEAIVDQKPEVEMLPVVRYEEAALNPLQAARAIEEEISYNRQVGPDNIGFFKAPFSFKGRIRRAEWWLSVFLINIYYFIFIAASGLNNRSDSNAATLLFLIPLFWFALAQGAKRCHDRGNSGWYTIIPFYGLWMAFGDSDIGPNQYGNNPKGKAF